jgi:hypothetical protein
VFLEDEMGVGPLPRRDESAQAWALSKLNRYASFMLQGSHRTFYAQKYPDGWEAELVLLVHSDERGSNLAEVIRESRPCARSSPRDSDGRGVAGAAYVQYSMGVSPVKGGLAAIA